MERWIDKVAAVTGAGSGIGAAVVVHLVNAGMIVVGLDLSGERIELSRQQFSPNARGKLHAVKCDISKDDDVKKAFAWIESELGSIEVLVNCAGVSKPTAGAITAEGNEDDLKQILQVNVWGMIMCIKKAVEIMKRNGVVGAHIININSVLGHAIFDFPGLNVYPISKYGITALCQVLRNEFNADKLQYKITSISPGLTKTGMLPKDIVLTDPYLVAKDVADAVLFALETPPHVQIAELTIRPVGGNI